MAVIKNISTGHRYTLYPGFIIGRTHGSSLHLYNGKVSGHHASFRWTNTGWKVCDLASKNGTFVDGERLQRGEHRSIIRGCRMAFGDTREFFEMEDDSAPEPIARTDAGVTVIGEDGVLALPNAEDPDVVVYRDRVGRWTLERQGVREKLVQDGEILDCGGRAYRLTLPLSWERTWQPDEEPLTLDRIGLRFQHAHDRFVHIFMLHDGGAFELPPRVHHRMLLELARQRVEDQADPDVSGPEEHGWMDVDALCECCDISELQLNLYVHRARTQFGHAGVMDHRRTVVRRRSPPTDTEAGVRQLRISVAWIEM